MNIEALSFEDKVDLLKQLVDDLDITLTAHYGAESYICSSNIQENTLDKTVTIWTGIMTG